MSHSDAAPEGDSGAQASEIESAGAEDSAYPGDFGKGDEDRGAEEAGGYEGDGESTDCLGLGVGRGHGGILVEVAGHVTRHGGSRGGGVRLVVDRRNGSMNRS